MSDEVTVDWDSPFWRWVHPEALSGCWLWHGSVRSKGYGQTYVLGAGQTRQAHRVAYALTHGAIPAGLMVCHRCDVALCVNPDHLFLGTMSDNSRDMYRKRRGRADTLRFTNAQVVEIRARAAAGEAFRALARMYEASDFYIRDIAYGRSYAEVGGPLTVPRKPTIIKEPRHG